MKKVLANLLVVVLIFTIIPFGFKVSAMSDGYYTYTVSNDPATLIDVDDNLAYKYDEQKLEATVIGCNEAIAEVIIPITVIKNETSYTVTGIDKNSFKNNQYLESVSIPDSVTSIGEYAFYNCENLKTINLGHNVKNIGLYAFSNTSPKNVYYNGSYRHRVENITSGSIGGGLILATWHYSVNEDLVYGYDDTTLTATVLECNESASDIVIPTTVNKDGKDYTVKTIGNSAFFRLIKLRSITIADSVTSIEPAAFSGCTALESVTIGNGLKSIGNLAFYNCTSLESITLGKNITSIGKNVFRYCNAVCRFYKNSYAEEYCIENNVAYIYIDATDKESVFSGKTGRYTWTLDKRTGILSIIGSGDMLDFSSESSPWYDYRLYISSVKLPKGITKIGQNAFENFVHLKNINIEDNVLSIGNRAFYGCESLETLSLPDSVKQIGEYAFKDCIFLRNVIIGKGITEIPAYSFYGCTRLSDFKMGNSIKSIGDYAFYGCSALTDINIPFSVTCIENNAYNNSSITNVWYVGSKEDEKRISLLYGNSKLAGATWHYNACSIGEYHCFDETGFICKKCNFSKYMLGNINYDNVVNLSDVVVLAQVVAGWSGVSHNEITLDVNGDDTVDLRDVTHLAQYVAGWEKIVLY